MVQYLKGGVKMEETKNNVNVNKGKIIIKTILTVQAIAITIFIVVAFILALSGFEFDTYDLSSLLLVFFTWAGGQYFTFQKLAHKIKLSLFEKIGIFFVNSIIFNIILNIVDMIFNYLSNLSNYL